MKRYKWLDKYCLNKPAVKKVWQEEWLAMKYMIRDKMYLYTGDHKDGRPIITLKAEPETGEILRQKYEDVIPGYYMNKDWWNSVYLDGKVPDDVLKEMIDNSYELVLGGFPKKIQAEIKETGK